MKKFHSPTVRASAHGVKYLTPRPFAPGGELSGEKGIVARSRVFAEREVVRREAKTPSEREQDLVRGDTRAALDERS